MRLCFVSHTSFKKEQGVYYYNSGFAKLLEMIAPLYDEVELCAPVFEGPPNKTNAKFCIPNVKLCPLPQFYKNWDIAAFKHPFMLMRCIWPYIKRADSVLMNMPDYLGILSWLVCLVQRKRFVMRMEGNWPEMMRMAFKNHGMIIRGNIVSFLYRLLVKTMVKTSALTIVIGQELADIYGRNNSHVVCVISSTFQAADIALTIAGSGQDDCRVLYVGRLQNSKGLSELFNAAKDLLAEGLDFRILLAGDGHRRNDLEKQAEGLGIIGRIDFLGWIAIEKLKDIYRTCDVFVLPSYTEGMPRTILEAMSNGVAVVATSVGGIPGVVEDGKSGFIVPPRNVPQLREALRRLILDKPLRQRMARVGLERSHKFTVEIERAAVRAALQKFGFLPNTGT
jgi:glycosyltransferase involved in cell wall biosynthesis